MNHKRVKVYEANRQRKKGPNEDEKIRQLHEKLMKLYAEVN